MASIEREYVHDTYQKIAYEFSVTRAYLWKGVKDFLDNVEPHSLIVEIGSGNGKNMLYRNDCLNLAFDLCENFTKISNNKGIDSVVSNNLKIPLKSGVADYVLSIAVIHHFSTIDRRLRALNELIRILKIGGKLLIQVWALEQPKDSKRKFVSQDNYVAFSNPQGTLIGKRFYHVFRESELEELVKQVKNIRILTSYWEIGNWVMILEKLW